MGCVLKQRTLMVPTPVPSVGMDESSLLHSLTTLTRRANPISHTSSDVIQAVLEVIRNSSSCDRNQGNEATNLDRRRPSTSNISSNAVNGFGHFAKGHKVESAFPAAVASTSRYPTTTNVAVRTYSSGSASTASLTQSAAHTPTALHLPNSSHPPGAPRPPNAAHPPSGLHPANATHPLSVRAVAAPVAYMSYQPAVPPPAGRGYYSQPYPSTVNHLPNHQSYPNSPARMAVTPQVPARPSSLAPAPPVQNAQNYNIYAMGRYPPQPHNYPPFP